MITEPKPQRQASATGVQVKSLSVGDHVVPLDTGLGTWRQAGVLDAAALHPVPQDLPLEAAATMTIKCAAVHVHMTHSPCDIKLLVVFEDPST